MKSIQIIWTVAAAMVVTACTSEQTLEEVFSEGEISEVKITATNFDYSNAVTRTSFGVTSSGVEFSWAANDTVGIFPNTGNQVEFPMTAGAGTKSAAFDGGGWGLKSGSTYYAYFPFSKYNYLLNDAKSKIPVSYTGQKQTGNGSTAHMGIYDFMAAPGSSPVNGALSFQFAHLNALVQIKIPAPAAATYKSLKLSASSPIFVESATVDLTASTPAVAATKLSNKLTLDLDVTATAAGEDLIFYMMLAPMDNFSGVKAHLTDADNNKTIFKLSPKDKLEAGFAYAVSGSIPEFVEFEDAFFESYILHFYDKDKNGKISMAEAAEVETIVMYGPSFTSIADIELFTNLVNLEISSTEFTSLDISDLTALQSLTCTSNNQLTSLNISDCTALKTLNCSSNYKLTSLDISGSAVLQTLVCRSNYKLTSLDLSSYTALQELDCASNQLTSLDLSDCCKTLQTLNCSSNPLVSLDVSACLALQELKFLYCNLEVLDVSGLTALQKLDCSSMTSTNYSLTSLNARGCTALQELKCYYNKLTSLDVSGCIALTRLDCYNNQLTELDVSSCTALQHLGCQENQLISLNARDCTALWDLSCFSNQLTSLDLSGDTALELLMCDKTLTPMLPTGITFNSGEATYYTAYTRES